MVNDANWVYDASKPVFFADKSTGACRVTMITKKVRMPADTPYQVLFIATPTRPLPELNRVIPRRTQASEQRRRRRRVQGDLHARTASDRIRTPVPEQPGQHGFDLRGVERADHDVAGRALSAEILGSPGRIQL